MGFAHSDTRGEARAARISSRFSYHITAPRNWAFNRHLAVIQPKPRLSRFLAGFRCAGVHPDCLLCQGTGKSTALFKEPVPLIERVHE